MTPTRPLRVAATAAAAPGAMTPSTGTRSASCNRGTASAVAVLHATTMALAPSAEQQAGQFEAVPFDGRRALVAVGDAGVVAEIENVFRRQQPPQGADDGQPADAGIEHPDGPPPVGVVQRGGERRVFQGSDEILRRRR